MKAFEMLRVDATNQLSRVLEGIVFSDGTCAVRWLKEGQPNCTALWASFSDFNFIHVEERAGKERTSDVRWLD